MLNEENIKTINRWRKKRLKTRNKTWKQKKRASVKINKLAAKVKDSLLIDLKSKISLFLNKISCKRVIKC